MQEDGLSISSEALEAPTLLHHGGRLRAAAERYAIPFADWLDLSTGINPNGWPVPPIPAPVWSRLPEDDDGLHQAARQYYGTDQILPVAGSQAALQILPQLRPPVRVHVLNPGYAEHAHAWRRAGHTVMDVNSEKVDDVIPHTDVLVLTHPNNPTGTRFSVEQLLDWHYQLYTRGGWLVVDEAFMDMTPEQSLIPYCHQQGLIVLRSLGKFFGLAGGRVGFVCAQDALLTRLNAILGPWTISGPARWVATQALQDKTWQNKTRLSLHRDGARLRALLAQHGFTPDGDCSLFKWLQTDRAKIFHEQLAGQGIFTRLFSEPSSLRFGLPGNELAWRRLSTALAQMAQMTKMNHTGIRA